MHRPAAVINAAAYTQVDGAETDAARAHMINAAAPEAMAEACAGLGVPFVSLSTDYVFDGSGMPLVRDRHAWPLNGYGRSKLAGEQAIAAVGWPWAVMRTSWVVSAHGGNFVKTMLRLGAERDASECCGGPDRRADPCARYCAGLSPHGQNPDIRA